MVCFRYALQSSGGLNCSKTFFSHALSQRLMHICIMVIISSLTPNIFLIFLFTLTQSFCESSTYQYFQIGGDQQEVAERHAKELEDAKHLGAEEEQQKFTNMSWLERIQKK